MTNNELIEIVRKDLLKIDVDLDDEMNNHTISFSNGDSYSSIHLFIDNDKFHYLCIGDKMNISQCFNY